MKMDRLNLLTLGVRDMVASLKFYRDGLGFDVSIIGDEEQPGVIFFKNKGTKISLFPVEELILDIASEEELTAPTGFTGVTLAYNGKSKAEVDEVMEQAVAAGAEMIKAPQATSWGGYGGYFKELNGFYWEVAYGADWEFDENDMLIV